MKKILITCILMLCMIFSITGCGTKEEKAKTVEAVDGYAEGRMGDILRNTFFEYKVKSAKYVKEYAGYKPAEGNVLIDAVIEMKNIFGEEIPMYYDDFQIQWRNGNDDEDRDNNFGYAIEALNDTMIPDEFPLKRGETKEYHCVYEVPKGFSEYSISYLEYFDDDTEGNVFFVYFELD